MCSNLNLEYQTQRESLSLSPFDAKSTTLPQIVNGVPSARSVTCSQSSENLSAAGGGSDRGDPKESDELKTLGHIQYLARKDGNYFRPKDKGKGRVCLHTHHHHYWITTVSSHLQQPTLKNRFSGERISLAKDNKKDDMEEQWRSCPSERDVEALALTERPPSRNTHRRYHI